MTTARKTADFARLPRTGASLTRVLAVLRNWSIRRAERQALLRLDGHLLKDIGLDRDLAMREAAKPFWTE